MRVATTIFTLFLASAQAFSPIAPSSRSATTTTRISMSSPLDGLNREMLNDDDDDDVPMTKAEMRAAEKEMKAEMKRLKDEAAAAAKDE
eukprot:CAMPEP_0119013246 /NCGR_PEP_ID=MMETSP1176-20130426/8238_1 /TAXON_ID=265551 /ORGANISM="Synedropsis recta cf, Strain CCMP1620" /LENGTH=88 /DNA_ID=CAMNT_0006966325 /DNA_START=85 /DNA_END=351 /DNA_ORIENTATION=+